MQTVWSERQFKRIIHRCQLPYFTARGWATLAVIGMAGGIIGGFLFSVAVNSFSK